jgi:hypothetical protein
MSDGDTPSRRIPWARLAAEMVVIVVSVLLALLVDDWRQGRQEAQLVEAVTTLLLQELHPNQVALEQRLPYHREMLDTFGVRAGQLLSRSGATPAARGTGPDVPLLPEMGFEDGLMTTGGFARSAMETVVTSGAVNHMDLSLVFVLSNTYASQQEMTATQDRLLETFGQYQLAAIEGERPAFATAAFRASLTDLLLREDELCGWYVLAARRLGGDDPPDMGECGSGRVTVR